MVLRSFDAGITHFDLANNYGPPPGSAEENFGRILAADLAPYRDELVISTKAGYLMWPGPYGEWGSRKYVLASLDQSLRAWGSSMSTFSTRTVMTPTRRWRKRWVLSIRPSAAAARCM
jgi:aryl-alcohol dehydrogenase-like predicted oxidoreductase